MQFSIMMNMHGAGGSDIAHTMTLAQMHARSLSRCIYNQFGTTT